MDYDELSALPPENAVFATQSGYPSRRTSKSGALSFNPQWRGAVPREGSHSPLVSTAATDNSSHFPSEKVQHRPSAPTILAPTPRRHLIETSESQHWLNLSEQHVSRFSPPSPASPTGSIFSIAESAKEWPESPSIAGFSGGGYPGSLGRSSSNSRPRTKRQSTQSSVGSFSALYQQEHKTLRRRQVSNPSIASTSALHKSAVLRSRPHNASSQRALGASYIRFMHKWGLKHLVIPVSIAFATLLKLCLGMGSYSGEKTPPMYGDYEAQRHWMELTIHLRFREWYTYDLQYWGLDYPPLTAYVSWICGLVAHYVEPTWVALNASRGVETPGSKLFMRLTVVFWDLLVYVPALLMFVKTWQSTRSHRTQELAFLTLLLQPGLLLIDHGHFQYNSVMLGLTLLAINFFSEGRDLLGAVCFVFSLGFKQMALYYAPAVGSYLLAKCIWLGYDKGLRLFIRLGATTLLSFALLFAPFFLPPLAPSFSHIFHPITRIFPFNRGLFEDKVANFWCASNVVIKWKKLAETAANGDEDRARGWLVKLSTMLTAVGFTPSVAGILRAAWVAKPESTSLPAVELAEEFSSSHKQTGDELAATPNFISLLPYALLTSSMSFFLFSFQVHEKTILLPLLPLTLLMSAAPIGSTLHSWGALGNNIAVFSMWPLLKRDGHGLACLATLALWNRVVGHNPFAWILVPRSNVKENIKPWRIKSAWELSLVQAVCFLVYGASTILVFLEGLIPIPARYPDLFSVLNVLISTPVFILIWLWSIKCGVEVGWAIGGWGSRAERITSQGAPALLKDPSQPSTASEEKAGEKVEATDSGS